jgi:hypothetical protein
MDLPIMNMICSYLRGGKKQQQQQQQHVSTAQVTCQHQHHKPGPLTTPPSDNSFTQLDTVIASKEMQKGQKQAGIHAPGRCARILCCGGIMHDAPSIMH